MELDIDGRFEHSNSFVLVIKGKSVINGNDQVPRCHVMLAVQTGNRSLVIEMLIRTETVIDFHSHPEFLLRDTVDRRYAALVLTNPTAGYEPLALCGRVRSFPENHPITDPNDEVNRDDRYITDNHSPFIPRYRVLSHESLT